MATGNTAAGEREGEGEGEGEGERERDAGAGDVPAPMDTDADAAAAAAAAAASAAASAAAAPADATVAVRDEDAARREALDRYIGALLAHQQAEERVRAARAKVKAVEDEYEKTEEDLKALQSVGQIVGEVLKQLDPERFIVKASSGPRYVVGCRARVNRAQIKQSTRVALDVTTLTIMRTLPREVDPMVFKMQAESNVSVSYSQVGGLSQQIRELREVVELPLTNPELFLRVGINPPKGVLLYGPPGTGKTLLAKAIASNIDAHFLKVVSSAIVDKYIGESARLIREMFGYARDHQPCIAAGTPITLADGTSRRIEDVVVAAQRQGVLLASPKRGVPPTKQNYASKEATLGAAADKKEEEEEETDDEGGAGSATEDAPDDDDDDAVASAHAAPDEAGAHSPVTKRARIDSEAVVAAPVALSGRVSVVLESAACNLGWDQGEKECVNLTLQDGRTLVCTPDHRVLTADGEWVEAVDIRVGETRLAVAALDAPLDEPGDDEHNFVLQAGPLTLRMDSDAERAKALAFARLLGYLLGDGHLLQAEANEGEICVGQQIDLSAVVRDAKLLTAAEDLRITDPTDTQKTWSVHFKGPLVEAFRALGGVRVGKRACSHASLPSFLKTAPLAIVREFVAGLFGADGCAPVLHKKQAQDDVLDHVTFVHCCLSDPAHIHAAKQYMEKVVGLLGRCGVRTDGYHVAVFADVRYGESSHRPMDGHARKEVRLSLPDSLSFGENVGFRFCVQKQLRLAAASAYWRQSAKILAQRHFVASRTIELVHDSKVHLTWNAARLAAVRELRDKEAIVHEVHSVIGTKDDERLSLATMKRVAHSKALQLEGYKKADFFSEIQCSDWFDANTYVIGQRAVVQPTLALRVVDRRDAGEHRVFDLAVPGNEAFFAGGVAAHNCIIFMDEIDAIGGRRFSEGTSADREIQRTLMELLNQMDGFESLGKVKIIMATNRPDVLDPALLRTGRLDRKIEIPLPNESSRLEILQIHAKGITKHGDIDFEAIVKLTDGFNGADLRNVCTEAGMFAIRADRDYVIEEDFMKAARKVGEAKKLESQIVYDKL